MFREADKETIILDEMGEMDLAMRVKLLRLLEEKKIRRGCGLKGSTSTCG